MYKEKNTAAYCTGDYYAGLFAKNDNNEYACEMPLSGSTNIPDQSIEYDAIKD